MEPSLRWWATEAKEEVGRRDHLFPHHGDQGSPGYAAGFPRGCWLAVEVRDQPGGWAEGVLVCSGGRDRARGMQALTSSPWSASEQLLSSFPLVFSLVAVVKVTLFWRGLQKASPTLTPAQTRVGCLFGTPAVEDEGRQGASRVTLVRVLFIWSMCSDVTESGPRSSPSCSLPSSLRAGPAQAKWYSAVPLPWASLRWR